MVQKKARMILFVTGRLERKSELIWKSMVNALALLVLASAGPILTQAQISSFQHVVLIVQENRTPDNLFQGLCGTGRSLCPSPYDLQNFGTDNLGNTIQLSKQPEGPIYDPAHDHPNFVTQCDLDTTTNQCKMDGLSSAKCPDDCSFQYLDPADVAPYVTLAQQYGWANYMFQTNQGPSPPAHAIIFGGTAAPSAADDAAATFVASWQYVSGCLSPLNAVWEMISPQTAPNLFELVNSPLGTTCFTHDTVATLLDHHKPRLSWKYYAPSATSIWNAVSWFQDICKPNAAHKKCLGAEWANDVDLNPTDVLTDISACNLRNVVWVIPSGQNSDHPGKVSGDDIGGPSWVASIVNQIGQSTCTDTINGKPLTYWQDTAILVTWDDWGGWFDHEPPTLLSVPSEGQGDYQYGFRVPLVVVSAYTPMGYIDNNRNDFGSIVRFVENNFGFAEGTLNFADARATTDLTDFFNLSQSPRTFTPISAPLGVDFFLHDKRPMEDPDTD